MNNPEMKRGGFSPASVTALITAYAAAVKTLSEVGGAVAIFSAVFLAVLISSTIISGRDSRRF